MKRQLQKWNVKNQKKKNLHFFDRAYSFGLSDRKCVNAIHDPGRNVYRIYDQKMNPILIVFMVSILPTKLRIQSFYLTKSTNLKHDVMPLRMLDEYEMGSWSVFNLSPHSLYSLSPLSSHSQKKLFRRVIKDYLRII